MGGSENKLLSTLGLFARARKLVIGTPMVCEALRKGASGSSAVVAVIEACDTSDNTHEKIVSKCRFYGIKHYRIEVSAEELARSIGKTGAVAAVGVTDADMYKALSKYLPEIQG